MLLSFLSFVLLHTVPERPRLHRRLPTGAPLSARGSASKSMQVLGHDKNLPHHAAHRTTPAGIQGISLCNEQSLKDEILLVMLSCWKQRRAGGGTERSCLSGSLISVDAHRIQSGLCTQKQNKNFIKQELQRNNPTPRGSGAGTLNRFIS